MNEELQSLNRVLTMKEELMPKRTVNDSRFVAIKFSYKRNLKNLEDQIEILQKERKQNEPKLA